ncbi:alternate-type signal peptide domain-containing protein [Nocardioides sp. MH1]|uniref:alternate-type signal peptide domain-containing protein n=1 Tax=Nocardioides sp. MH1 TaxID=3242490 RepID=UPI0035219EB5
MKKSTKGALAAGAAAFLLLGGAGTLAYWTDDADVDGGTVSSGSIELQNVSCATSWTYSDGSTTGITTVSTIVPGDKIVKECTGDLVLVGDHIGATVGISDASLTSLKGLEDELTVGASLTAPAGGSVTGAGTYPVTIDITVDFPYGTVSSPDPTTGADNDSQVDTATLDKITLVAVQTHK